MERFIFFVLAIISVGFFMYEVSKRYLYTKLGRPENRFDHPDERLQYFFSQILGHQRLMRKPLFGILHWFIMWGFLVLLAGMLNMAAEGLYHTSIPYIGDNRTYLLIKDVFVALIAVGIIGSLLRRTVLKPDWLKNTPVAFVILLLILIIVFSEALFHGLQIALGVGADMAGAAPLASTAAGLFGNMNKNSIYTARAVFFWAHFLAVFSLLFIVPRSKHLHLVFAPFNTYWHKLEPKGAIRKIDFAKGKVEIYGVNKMEDFTWKQLFDAYACVKCGRCDERCPAHQSGEKHKPKRFNGRLRKHIDSRAPILIKYSGLQALQAGNRIEREALIYNKVTKDEQSVLKKNIIGDVFEEEFIWDCTTCGACVATCPISVEHTSRLFDMRRYIVSAGLNIPEAVRTVFAGIEKQGNPWGMDRGAAHDWVKELGAPTLDENPGAEYLYFVGCAGLFEDSARKTTAAFIKVLQHARVSFAILGREDWCCGETARRMGNEYLYQQIVMKNIAAWNDRGIKKILTTCPHCFNTLKNEYPQFGAAYEVNHHSVFLADLLRRGVVMPCKNVDKTVVYHDPCYLGRYNDICNEPREVLRAIPGVLLLEMPLSRESSLCCGAGGGRFWTKERYDNPVGKDRTREALATGAEVVCTTCPYCMTMFSEGLRVKEPGRSMDTMDIAELIEMSIK